MSGWTVVVSDDAGDEIKNLPVDMQARFLHIAEMLEELGPQKVGMPHVRHVRGKLWEMRMRGRDGIARAVYFAASGKRLVVVRAFVKKTEKTPGSEIDLAERRMKGFADG